MTRSNVLVRLPDRAGTGRILAERPLSPARPLGSSRRRGWRRNSYPVIHRSWRPASALATYASVRFSSADHRQIPRLARPGSIALLSSLVNSLLDAVASRQFVRSSACDEPADREHRFRHGKAEPLAMLGRSAFITGSAMLLVAQAIRRLLRPVPIRTRRSESRSSSSRSRSRSRFTPIERRVVRRTGSSRSAPTNCVITATWSWNQRYVIAALRAEPAVRPADPRPVVQHRDQRLPMPCARDTPGAPVADPLMDQESPIKRGKNPGDCAAGVQSRRGP